MAEEKKPGQGWAKKTDNAYEATFSWPKTPSAVTQTGASSGTTQNTDQKVRVIVNNETGAIQLYEVRGVGVGDRLFNTFNPSTGKWVAPSNDPQALTDITSKIGPDGLQKLQNESKSGAINGVINPTSSNQSKQNILNTEGYKTAKNTIKADPNEASGGEDGTTEAPLDGNTLNGNLSSLVVSSSTENRDISKYPDNSLLKYPKDLNLIEQDCIQFRMLKYEPKKYDITKIGETGGLTGRNQNRQGGSTVTLPIQPSITDTNTVDWGSDTMDAGQLVAASAALATILSGGEGATASVNAIVDLIGGANEDLKKTFAAGMAGQAAGTKGLLTRVTGGIVNPNMELLFNGPQLRSFTFNFTLSAREKKESEIIRNIIRFFKQGMSVKRSTTDLFLSSPHTFEIKYLHKNQNHPWINKIKECALLNCSVNYTPAQNYATFSDGAMTSYEIALQFTELEPIYDTDYGALDGNKDTQIGY